MKTRIDISYDKGEDALTTLVLNDFPHETLKSGLLILVNLQGLVGVIIDEDENCRNIVSLLGYNMEGISDWVTNQWCSHQALLLKVDYYIISYTDEGTWEVEVRAWEENNNGNIMSQFRSFQAETSKL